MTKLTAMPIYDKNLLMMRLGWHFTFMNKVQLWFLILVYGKMLKWLISQKLLKPDIKVSINNEYMRIHVYQTVPQPKGRV